MPPYIMYPAKSKSAPTLLHFAEIHQLNLANWHSGIHVLFAMRHKGQPRLHELGCHGPGPGFVLIYFGLQNLC